MVLQGATFDLLISITSAIRFIFPRGKFPLHKEVIDLRLPQGRISSPTPCCPFAGTVSNTSPVIIHDK